MYRTMIACLILLFCTTASFAGEDEDEEEALEEEKGPVTISYHMIKPSLVANLASGGKYIRTDIQVMTDDENFMENLELHDPAVRHTLLMLLSEQDGKTIKTPAGKEALRKEAMSQVNQVMMELSGQESVQEIYFTTFFVQ